MTTKTIAFFVDSEPQWTKKVSIETLKQLPSRDCKEMAESMDDCGAPQSKVDAAVDLFTCDFDRNGLPVKWGLTFDGMAQYTVVLD